MTVIPFRAEQGAPGSGPLRGFRNRVPVRGWFTTPHLGAGSFTGSLRVLHLSRRHARLRCQGVVGGTLYDGAGNRLGSASQRCQLPLEVHWDGGGRLSVGPVEVDLLGLRVHVDRVMLWSDRHGRPVDDEGPAREDAGPADDARAADRRVLRLVRSMP
jgi:hypothetical protein